MIKIGKIYKVGNSIYTVKDVGKGYVWLMATDGNLRPMLRAEFENNAVYKMKINWIRNILFRLNLLKITM